MTQKVVRQNMKLINKAVRFLEKSISSTTKITVAGVATLSILVLGSLLYLNTRPNITDATVMLTSLYGGGGTGVIVSSNAASSKVLTNAHVCGVLKSGGIASTNSGSHHTVSSYRVSQLHDLCLVSVNANLGNAVELSTSNPRIFEHAIVSGHPRLYPNVITEGHFSGHKIISVLTGFRDCTEEDTKDEGGRLVCALLGRMPVIKTYDTVLVTATIMPGSSGSAVYNSNKELSGLVFAGSGDLGYAFTVPYEYVANFLLNESNRLIDQFPNYEASLYGANNSKNNLREQVEQFRESCSLIDVQHPEVKRICDAVRNDVIWDY